VYASAEPKQGSAGREEPGERTRLDSGERGPCLADRRRRLGEEAGHSPGDDDDDDAREREEREDPEPDGERHETRD
jgi:hypothetical protein